MVRLHTLRAKDSGFGIRLGQFSKRSSLNWLQFQCLRSNRYFMRPTKELFQRSDLGYPRAPEENAKLSRRFWYIHLKHVAKRLSGVWRQGSREPADPDKARRLPASANADRGPQQVDRHLRRARQPRAL
ncbi:jg5235 [Pararge aegeria aegeria]|uniref:Jg5235 protein n=1 Tax=Pararge aegeria aegeria TaxID=348720 RepID=A0A8S4RG29_9NEOP|nr:jg5235 [Pararge aegeria aegeria]